MIQFIHSAVINNANPKRAETSFFKDLYSLKSYRGAISSHKGTRNPHACCCTTTKEVSLLNKVQPWVYSLFHHNRDVDAERMEMAFWAGAWLENANNAFSVPAAFDGTPQESMTTVGWGFDKASQHESQALCSLKCFWHRMATSIISDCGDYSRRYIISGYNSETG